MNQNTESIIFYQYLVDDCDTALQYWNHEPDGETKTEQLVKYTHLKLSHLENIDRLKLQLAQDGTDLIDDIQEYIIYWEKLLKRFGAYIPDGVKEFFAKLIEVSKKILEQLNLST